MTEYNKPLLFFVLVKGPAGRKGKSDFITPQHLYLFIWECHHLSHCPVSTVAAGRLDSQRYELVIPGYSLADTGSQK